MRQQSSRRDNKKHSHERQQTTADQRWQAEAMLRCAGVRARLRRTNAKALRQRVAERSPCRRRGEGGLVGATHGGEHDYVSYDAERCGSGGADERSEEGTGQPRWPALPWNRGLGTVGISGH